MARSRWKLRFERFEKFEGFERVIVRKDITTSTNLDARSGVPGDVFTAEFQTAGRGRLDHKWQSAKSENLMFSMVLGVGERPPAEIATLPLVVGLSIVSSLSSILYPLSSVSLKWPNDILVGGRKLCGILCERAGDNVIAGVGVNVNQTAFPSDIADRATSLALLVKGTVDREAVLQALIASINAHHARWMANGFALLLPELSAYDVLSGRTVSVRATDDDAEPITGMCGGVQSDGSLLVGDKRVYAGEAHVCAVAQGKVKSEK